MLMKLGLIAWFTMSFILLFWLLEIPIWYLIAFVVIVAGVFILTEIMKYRR